MVDIGPDNISPVKSTDVLPVPGAYRDALVSQLDEALSLNGKTQQEKMAIIFSLAPAKFVNYAIERDELTAANEPRLIQNEGGRPLICMLSLPIGGTYGLEGMRFALQHALSFDGATAPAADGNSTQKIQGQNLLPYPHCEEQKNITAGNGVTEEAQRAGVKGFTIMAVSPDQLDILKRLVAPPTPTTAADTVVLPGPAAIKPV